MLYLAHSLVKEHVRWFKTIQRIDTQAGTNMEKATDTPLMCICLRVTTPLLDQTSLHLYGQEVFELTRNPP